LTLPFVETAHGIDSSDLVQVQDRGAKTYVWLCAMIHQHFYSELHLSVRALDPTQLGSAPVPDQIAVVSDHLGSVEQVADRIGLAAHVFPEVIIKTLSFK